MKDKSIRERIIDFLRKKGGKATIHEFWRFYYQLGTKRGEEFRKLLKKGIVKYEVEDGQVKYVRLVGE